MGTRSDIIAHMGDGRWARIYCHWDGYLDYNGQILHDHYTSQDKIEASMTPQDFAALGQLLHGQGWRQSTADLLGVSKRNVDYWASGGKEIPPAIQDELSDEVRRRLVDRAELLRMWAHVRQLSHELDLITSILQLGPLRGRKEAAL